MAKIALVCWRVAGPPRAVAPESSSIFGCWLDRRNNNGPPLGPPRKSELLGDNDVRTRRTRETLTACALWLCGCSSRPFDRFPARIQYSQEAHRKSNGGGRGRAHSGQKGQSVSCCLCACARHACYPTSPFLSRYGIYQSIDP